MTAYIALLRKGHHSDFGVDFPDFPGCVTAGRTIGEARRMADEALSGHIAAMVEDGQEIPARDLATVLDEVTADPDNAGAIIMLVDAPVRANKSVRVNVMLPEDLLQQIDRASGNRSRFLADAARAKLRAA